MMRLGKSARQGNRPIVFKFSLTPVILITIIFVIWATLASSKEQPPLITFKTDDCPSCGCMRRYKVEFYPNGKVHWYGESYVHAKGHHYAKINKKQLYSWEEKLKNADFFNLPDDYIELLSKSTQ